MIATSEALDQFDRMLTVAGFDSERPDALLAWRVFKEFAAIPVDCADDALLFQVGTYSFTGQPLFHLDFTRQFSHEEDGEYSGMEQLHCTMQYEPVPELEALRRDLWSDEGSALQEFFDRVEAMPEFRIPTQRHSPVRAEIDQENV